MSLFKRRNQKMEPVKVVFVEPPKQDLGTRIKKLDFDPLSLGVGAAVPAVGIGLYKGGKAIAGMCSFRFIMRAVIADVSTETNSFAEYCDNVHEYLRDHPLTDRYNNQQKAELEHKLIRKLDKYWTKHPNCGCEDDVDEDLETEAEDEPEASSINPVQEIDESLEKLKEMAENAAKSSAPISGAQKPSDNAQKDNPTTDGNKPE